MEIQEERNLFTFLKDYKIYIIGLVIILLIAVLIFIFFKYIYIKKPAPEETAKEKTMEDILNSLSAPSDSSSISGEVLKSISAPSKKETQPNTSQKILDSLKAP